MNVDHLGNEYGLPWSKYLYPLGNGCGKLARKDTWGILPLENVHEQGYSMPTSGHYPFDTHPSSHPTLVKLFSSYSLYKFWGCNPILPFISPLITFTYYNSINEMFDHIMMFWWQLALFVNKSWHLIYTCFPSGLNRKALIRSHGNFEVKPPKVGIMLTWATSIIFKFRCNLSLLFT